MRTPEWDYDKDEVATAGPYAGASTRHLLMNVLGILVAIALVAAVAFIVKPWQQSEPPAYVTRGELNGSGTTTEPAARTTPGTAAPRKPGTPAPAFVVIGARPRPWEPPTGVTGTP